MMGETFQVIIADQFTALRDGDRLWFENQGLDPRTLAEIESTTLSDLILRNTDTVNIQDDAFVYYSRHSGVAGGIESENLNAPQLVVGSAGADTLVGGAFDDILVPGVGVQRLTGGAGGDAFVFNTVGITATITDFRPGTDVIEISAGAQRFTDLNIHRDPAGAAVDFAGTHIVLVGVAPNALGPGDLAFDS